MKKWKYGTVLAGMLVLLCACGPQEASSQVQNTSVTPIESSFIEATTSQAKPESQPDGEVAGRQTYRVPAQYHYTITENSDMLFSEEGISAEVDITIPDIWFWEDGILYDAVLENQYGGPLKVGEFLFTSISLGEGATLDDFYAAYAYSPEFEQYTEKLDGGFLADGQGRQISYDIHRSTYENLTTIYIYLVPLEENQWCVLTFYIWDFYEADPDVLTEVAKSIQPVA